MCWQRNAAATAGIPISRKPSKIAGKSLAFLFAVAEERYAFGSPGPDDCADRPGAGPPPADGRDVVGAFALRAAAQPVEKTLAPARASRGGKLPSERRSGDRVRHIGWHCEGRDECRSRDPERHATPAMLPCKPPRTVRFFYCKKLERIASSHALQYTVTCDGLYRVVHTLNGYGFSATCY